MEVRNWAEAYNVNCLSKQELKNHEKTQKKN